MHCIGQRHTDALGLFLDADPVHVTEKQLRFVLVYCGSTGALTGSGLQVLDLIVGELLLLLGVRCIRCETARNLWIFICPENDASCFVATGQFNINADGCFELRIYLKEFFLNHVYDAV